MRLRVPDYWWEWGFGLLIFRKKFSFKEKVKWNNKTKQKDLSQSIELGVFESKKTKQGKSD